MSNFRLTDARCYKTHHYGLGVGGNTLDISIIKLAFIVGTLP